MSTVNDPYVALFSTEARKSSSMLFAIYLWLYGVVSFGLLISLVVWLYDMLEDVLKMVKIVLNAHFLYPASLVEVESEPNMRIGLKLECDIGCIK
jgi:hypothetical protein